MDFPGCTVVETPHFNAGAVGSIPGGGLGEIPPTFRLYPSDSQYAVEKIINSYARGTQLKLLEFRGSNLSKVLDRKSVV